ncbi:hypothetical protein LNQ03_00845 [Klebsiella pneumoniae subsp. pneumoniae]|nr:hypothetical protein [Klebsiella pneumoniae subsp. pneumoniae]
MVRKLGLLDWYTRMSCRCAYSPQTAAADGRNALHCSSIIDVFNEYGVQIMSPELCDAAKGAAVVVPQEAWYAAPAVAPQKPEKWRG